MTTHSTAGRSRDTALVTASAFVDTVGDGLWMVGAGLFFVRSQGLPVTTVGLGLTAGGLVGLPAGVLLARVADRRGPRGTYVALTLLQAAAFLVLVGTRSVPVFVLAAAVAASANQGAQSIRSGIVRTLGGADAVRFRARLHVVMNVGISAGAALAGVLVAVGTRGAYVALVVGDAATFAFAGLLMGRTAPVPATSGAPATVRRAAVRDAGYLRVAAADGVLDLQFLVTGYLLPLWVALHTRAAAWLASPLLLLNTAVVVLFQVRVSAVAVGPAGAARAYRWAGAALAGAAVLFGVSGLVGPLAAAVLLVAAVAVHSLGELLHASGSFGLSYGLAPGHAVSEYQAVWSLGMGLARALGPAVLTLLCLRGGVGGWVGLAGLFAATGAAVPGLARRTGRPAVDPAAVAVQPA